MRCMHTLRALRACGIPSLVRVGMVMVAGGIVAAAMANPLAADTVIRPPLSITVNPAPTLPAESQALQRASAARLFDRDTMTEHAGLEAAQAVAQFDAPTEVRDLKFFGAAPYGVSVDAQVAGSWQAVAGWQNLNLAQRPPAWTTFSAATPVTATALRFNLAAASGGTATGLRAIEIWGKGGRVNLRDGLALLTALRSGTPPSQGRLYAAAPAQGVIGGASDDPSDNTFTVSLERDPSQFKRVYLAYDLLGLPHWASAQRSINGHAALGGFPMPAGSEGSTQVERIDPALLAAGPNRITFSAPAGMGSSYTVRNVVLVGELDSGANVVAAATANQPEEGNPPANLLDGDLATGWTPYPSGGSLHADVPALALTLDKPTQVDGVALYLVNALKGTVSVELQTAGVWTATGAAPLDARKLVAGWNTLPVTSAAAAQGVRLVFSGGQGSNAEIRELQVVGSGTGVATPPQFVLSHPEAGQYFGRTAYLRGFLVPAANASGPAQIFVGPMAVNSDAGSFGVAVSKDDMGQGSEGDSDPWTVELRAVYPDGTVLTRTVTLNNWRAAPESTPASLLPAYRIGLAPGQARKLVYDAATLDVPADALGGTTDVGITPLGADDLAALDTGMTNVTKGPRKGYRFTPTPMKFMAKLKVTLPYNKSLIPPGLTEDDVRTFWFDAQAGRWKPLELVAIDKAAQTVTSATDHFTDVINATVTVPDHPQTTRFNPTQIKDIQAADPGAQVNLMAPPAGNSAGDARLSYPIEVPPGRQGLQPQLAVQYNSAGGNGWTGLGWDVPMQAISIDTRWGVPRYDASTETETYLLQGEQLTPLAHRGAPPPRAADKVFHTRIEGQFQRIVRRGNTPANYRWEVTDKSGTRYFYGAASSSGAPEPGATLSDRGGNVFLWALREVRDLHGNQVKYTYARQDDVGVAGGTVPGTNLYLQRIAYTGSGSGDGPYTVTFVRDRELGEARRPDVQIDGRGGFKRVTADLLRRVDVAFNNALVRRYELQYATGAFNKTLLQNVIQYAEDGVTEFHRHRFAYYDEARDGSGAYKGFAPAAAWSIGSDGVGAPNMFGRGNASAIGGSKGTSVGGHLYVGVGVGDPTSKVDSAGFKVGYSSSDNEGLVALADMNGDGLPDKVFRGDGGFYYRPNLSKPGGSAGFGDKVRLDSLPAISQERSSSFTYGAEAYLAGFSAMIHANDASSRADTYLADVNGDGLVDLVSRGRVLFGYVNAQGVPTFDANSALTPVAIQSGAIDANGLLTPTPEDAAREADRANRFPLVDSVRRWVAPFDGTVQITAPVQLIEDTSDARRAYLQADGVRVAIQLEGAELWSTSIAATDYSPHAPNGVGAVPVHRGDRLYFRVQSVLNGAYDRVQWNPVIAYTGVMAAPDANGLDAYRYGAVQDFTLAGRHATVTLPLTGTLRLAGRFDKLGATTDDVTLLVTRNGMEVLRERFGHAELRSLELSREIAVNQGDIMAWQVLADSQVDLSRLRFGVPLQAWYTTAQGVDSVQSDTGEFIVKVVPSYDIETYTPVALTAPQAAWTAPADGTVTVRPSLGTANLGPGVNGRVIFTVKKATVLLGKQAIDIVNGVVPDPSALAFTVNALQNDRLFFDFTLRDAGLVAALPSPSVTVDGQSAPSALHAPAPEGAFPRPYRGWAAVGYNGNGDRGTQPIRQDALIVDNGFNPETALVQVFLPQPGADVSQDQWGATGNGSWVRAATMNASRLSGVDDVRGPRGDAFAGAAAPSRLAQSSGNTISVGGLGLGGAVSKGSSSSQLDFMDLNGDRFPDVVSASGVQYTGPTGMLEARRHAAADVRLDAPPRHSDNRTVNGDLSFSGSGGGNGAVAIANPRGMVAPDGARSAMTGKQGYDMPSLGFSVGASSGTSNTDHDLIDINGDGLPDRVLRDGRVQLNFGYWFGDPEPWNGGIVNDGTSRDLTGGINAGFNRDAYSWAGGLSLTIGESGSEEVHVDINGDGLPDKVFLQGDGVLGVRLNTGSGYSSTVIPWRNAQSAVARDKHLTLGGGVYVTFGFSFFGTAKVVFNPGVNLSTTMGRPEFAFRDLDGDGYVDHVRSERDGELSVAANPIGRTNLLRRVDRPLGASFELAYARDGNTYDLPQSRWNLSRVQVFDGLPGDGVDTLVTTFRYETPKYSRLEREFYGYARVVEEQRNAAANDALYRTVTRDFRNDSHYTHGLLAAEVTADAAGNRFTERLNTYVLRDVDTGAEPVDGSSTTATVFPQLTRSDHRFYEGGATAQKATSTQHAYDAVGNLIHFADAGDVGAQDDVEAFVDYTVADAACAANHVVGKPKRISVRGNGVLMRQRQAVIDCSTGDETQVTQFLENGQAATTDLAYFGNGNLQAITGPANRNGQRYALSYEYDPAVATHVTQVTDIFGYRSTAEYDLRFGQLTSSTDLNGQKTTSAFDAVGRTASVVGPYEQGTGQATIRFEYHPEAPVPYALTQHVDKDAAGALKDPIETLLYTDGLKRVVQTKKDAALYTQAGGAPSDAMIVSGRVVFDHVGRAIQQFYPTSEAKGSNLAFNSGFDGIAPTRTDFDVLDRPLVVTLPDATRTAMAYGFGADRAGLTQFETTVTDANGLRKQTYRDVRSLITSVKEFNQGGTIWTSYAYDPLKQIVQVVDDKNNLTRVAYDNLGRRTVIDNPDTGKTETVYDLASNAVARVTANLRAQGTQIALDYDFNRLKSVSYPSFPGNNLSYVYGAPGATLGRAGRIASVTSQMGREDREYGPLGEVVKETRTITTFTTPNAPEVYTTLYQYDTWNRMMRLTYPDGEVLTYAYDSGGLVKSAQAEKNGYTYAYLNRLEYDKFEQRAFMEQGNGIRTQYAYDPQNRRLANLQSGKGGAGNALQNLQYGYDKVGNILSLANAIPVPPPNQYGGPTQQAFAYDDLYRLTHAEGNYSFAPGKQRSYQLDLGYDSIHNITSKGQSDVIGQPSGTPVTQKKTSYLFNYAYNPSGAASVRPHAPVHIGDRTYGYDANGNQLGWTDDGNGTRRNIVWDEENRIQSVFDNGSEKAFKYNDDGDRVIKRGPQGETVYVNPYFTVRNKEIGTKHVFVGTSRLVSKLMKQDKPGANPQGRTPVEKDLYFFHPDHLGSSNVITDSQGQLYEHLEYFPFGETWVEESSNTQRTPYQFTGKELDEETGLYDFGARYYDPRSSVWQSADPALEQYLDDGAPGLGVRIPQNLSLYSYAWNNPLVHRDPDGRLVNLVTAAIGAGVGAVVGPVAYAGASLYRGEAITGRGLLGAAAGGAVTGGLAGLTGGGSLLVQAATVGGASVAGGVVNRGIVTGDVKQAVDPKAMAIDGGIGVATFGVVKAGGAAIAAQTGAAPLSRLVPGGGLAAHEAAGGHLLAKHVGQTGADLAARLAAQPRLSAASTFVSRTEAEAAMSGLLSARVADVNAWVAAGARGRLVLDGAFSGGAVLRRGSSVAVPGTGVRAVLEGTGGGGWRIITGYPTP